MNSSKQYLSIGCISGTSMDAIDVAAIKSDGQDQIENLGFATYPISNEMQNQLKQAITNANKDEIPLELPKLEEEVTDCFISAIKKFMNENHLQAANVDLIGNHGQTIIHVPEKQYTLQLSDNQKIAQDLKIDVIGDFRNNDLNNGGQGAPLAPIYHALLAKKLTQPLVILNLGGVANLSFIDENEIIAFDCGPANALLNDYMSAKFQLAMDEGGKLASSGKVADSIVTKFKAEDFFKQAYPKSLDRNEFIAYLNEVDSLAANNALATLAQLSIAGIEIAFSQLPKKVTTCYLAGGGRHNDYFLQQLTKILAIKVAKIEEIGANGDAIEAETFAYLAIRAKLELPFSFPSTTGVKSACSGGVFYQK